MNKDCLKIIENMSVYYEKFNKLFISRPNINCKANQCDLTDLDYLV